MSKVIEVARAELGQHEDPAGSNQCKYNTEYYGKEVSGDFYKWCVVLLWWIFKTAGERMAFFGGGKTASCGTLLRWYKEQGLIADKGDIQIGDIVILNFSGKMVNGQLDTEHCGLVVGKGKLAGTWYTVEGNTTPGEEGTPQEEYNGGCVALKLRSTKNMVGICRPQYKEEKMITDKPPDYTGTWSEKYFEWARRIGLVTGYEDGSFRPNAYPTRAELLAILYRYDEYRFGNSENKK